MSITDRSKFREEIERRLSKLSRCQQIKFAWLCAVRALPFLSRKRKFGYWQGEGAIQKNLLAVLRAVDIAAYASYAPYASYAAVYAAHAASDAASDADIAFYPIRVAAYASYAASDIAPLSYAASAACAASDAVYIDHASDCRKLLLSYVDKIYENKLDEIDHNMKIYGDGILWQHFQDDLKAIGCEYWAKLYADLFANKFAIDKKELKRRLDIPLEIREKGAKSVAEWLKKIKSQGAECLNEARIILLGEMGSGKTSLALKLQDINADIKSQESTIGVDLSLWKLKKNAHGEAINAHIWDFAGQAVTHSVHKFFLSERCVYIIVYDGRTEARNRLDYWLNLVETYGGNSPVFVLVNKHTDYSPDVNENGLKDEYPQIEGDFTYLSLLNDISGTQLFRDKIENFIKSKPAWNQEMPELWFAVKEELSKMFSDANTDLITTDEFKDIAEKYTIVKDKDFEAMRNALHALGICLYYDKIKELETYVLNPNWITNGIYAIINWLRVKQDYKIKISDLEIVFEKEEERYPKDKYGFLFELLELYDLAYPYKTKESDVLVIPALLTERQPERDMEREFPVSDSLCMRYRADSSLPPDTISRFIVHHHTEIMEKDNNQVVWRKGVKLQDGQGNIALVKEVDREIRLYVRGRTAKDFLSKLRENMNEIFKTYKSKYPTLEYRVFETAEQEITAEQEVYVDDKTVIASITNNINFVIVEGIKVDKLEIIAKTYNIKKELIMGSQYKAKQVAIQGEQAGKYATVNQFFFEANENIDHESLMKDIDLLRNHLRKEEPSDENDILIGEVAQLRKATEEKDNNKISDILQKTGVKILDIAQRVGCHMLANILTHGTGG